MSIKLTLLKTGEQLISEMKELVPEDQEQVHAYLLDNPHTVEINEKQFVTEEEKKEGDFGINVVLLPWIILSKDKKMIITDYQFISVFLNEYDFSPTRFWYDYHGYPKEKNELFEYWKEFVLKKIRTNDIKKIYVLKPLHGETKPLENVLKNCYRQENFSETFYKLILNNC